MPLLKRSELTAQIGLNQIEDLSVLFCFSFYKLYTIVGCLVAQVKRLGELSKTHFLSFLFSKAF